MVEEKKDDTKVMDYSLVEIPTGKALMIQDKDGTIISFEEQIVDISNRLARLEREVLGK